MLVDTQCLDDLSDDELDVLKNRAEKELVNRRQARKTAREKQEHEFGKTPEYRRLIEDIEALDAEIQGLEPIKAVIQVPFEYIAQAEFPYGTLGSSILHEDPENSLSFFGSVKLGDHNVDNPQFMSAVESALDYIEEECFDEATIKVLEKSPEGWRWLEARKKIQQLAERHSDTLEKAVDYGLLH